MNDQELAVVEHMIRVLGLSGSRHFPSRYLDPRVVEDRFVGATITYHRFGDSNVLLPYIYLEVQP